MTLAPEQREAPAAQENRTSTLLEQLAWEADLLGARYADGIPAHHRSDPEIYAALRAAVSFGCAIGLRRAAELITASRTAP